MQDLGKSSNDLLGKDYHFSGTSLEVKTSTPSNVTFKVEGSRDSKTSHVTGNLEGKYADKVHGLTITQAWTTHNALRTQIELENQIAKGLKLDTTTTLHPDKSTKSVNLGAAYKQPGLHARAVLDVFKVRSCDSSCPSMVPFHFMLNASL
jgi:voltage-dependent anion channel protein 2